MTLSQMDTTFINAMVRAMYDEERRQIGTSALMTDAEMLDFYMAYMAYHH